MYSRSKQDREALKQRAILRQRKAERDQRSLASAALHVCGKSKTDKPEYFLSLTFVSTIVSKTHSFPAHLAVKKFQNYVNYFDDNSKKLFEKLKIPGTKSAPSTPFSSPKFGPAPALYRSSSSVSMFGTRRNSTSTSTSSEQDFMSLRVSRKAQ